MPSSLGALAGAKILGHGAKYPWANIFGLLLESSDSQGEICDALPLFHTPLLQPTLQIALLLVEQHCLQTKTRICGAYYCGEQQGLPVVKKALQQIATSLKIKQPILLVIKPALEVTALTSPDWSAAVQKFKTNVDASVKLAQSQAKICDFEDTLEDPSLDFRNN